MIASTPKCVRCLSFHCDTDLILKETAAKRPDTAEDEVQLVPLLGAVGWSVLWREHALEQVTQHLQMADVCDRRDLLETEFHHFETCRHVLVKENRQIGAFRLHLSCVDPAAHWPANIARWPCDRRVFIRQVLEPADNWYKTC